MTFTKILYSALLFSLATITYADSIELSNGKIFQGDFTGRSGDSISFEVDGITMNFNAKDVKNISMGSSNTEAAKPVAQSTKPAVTSTKATGPVEIPVGSMITIRLSDTLSTGKHTTGHKFTAVLEGALVSNGTTVAPAGSQVYGVISESVKARRVRGKAKMLLTITDIKINGQIIPIRTSAINAYTQATGKASAAKVARGAAIGGLANGSDGAKTGAKVGLAGAILSPGSQVVIPVDTLLDFTLSTVLKTS
ncbi:MAG: hypothetical protein JKY50_05300 [Oleispira sp.]|nr:hypothetical protein [Oleispira sp.]MBL4882709.1 hypothetical protein [Oleispira sp.]